MSVFCVLIKLLISLYAIVITSKESEIDNLIHFISSCLKGIRIIQHSRYGKTPYSENTLY